MIVCACQNVTLDDIVDAVKLFGNDSNIIKDKLEIGKGCEECLDAVCESVDLPWPYAMMNAEAILRENS